MAPNNERGREGDHDGQIITAFTAAGEFLQRLSARIDALNENQQTLADRVEHLIGQVNLQKQRDQAHREPRAEVLEVRRHDGLTAPLSNDVGHLMQFPRLRRAPRAPVPPEIPAAQRVSKFGADAEIVLPPFPRVVISKHPRDVPNHPPPRDFGLRRTRGVAAADKSYKGEQGAAALIGASTASDDRHLKREVVKRRGEVMSTAGEEADPDLMEDDSPIRKKPRLRLDRDIRVSAENAHVPKPRGRRRRAYSVKTTPS